MSTKVTNYMADAFVSYGFDKSQADNRTIFIDVVTFIMTLLCVVIIERVGRRVLMLVGCFGLSITLVSLAVCPILIVSISMYTVQCT